MSEGPRMSFHSRSLRASKFCSLFRGKPNSPGATRGRRKSWVWLFLPIFAALAGSSDLVFAQSILGFSCIGTSCPDGTGGLRSYATSGPPAKYASVSGYVAGGDGGGGNFYNFGTTAAVCGSPTGGTGTS